MSNLVNHLADSNAQRQVAAIASGRHEVRGHLAYSYSTGVFPNHTVYFRQVLGMGTWEGVEAVFYELPNGTIVLSADNYRFYDGTQTTPGEWFPDDIPHTGFVILDVKLPEGFGEVDTKANPPTGVIALCKCEKFPDFDEDGNQIDEDGVIVSAIDEPLDEDAFFYSVNPNRVRLGWALKYGGIKRRRENYAKWVETRDFYDEPETVDYTTLENFPGFGMTGSYFNGTNFDTFIVKRVDPSLYFASSAGAPVAGVNVDNFSVRWEGFIKSEFSETYTFTASHTNGAKVIIGGDTIINAFAIDGTTPTAITTGTKALVADTFYPVTVEWNAGVGNADFLLRWNSASLPIEVIPPERMYPKVEEKPKYEAHIAFSTPTDLDTMIDTVLLVSNSIRQDVDGKFECSCVEQLIPSFNFDENLSEGERLFIDGTSTLSTGGVLLSNMENVFEAEFNDLDSQYLQKPVSPLQIVVEWLKTIAGREIYSLVPLPNMSRFQAQKILRRLVNIQTKRLTLKGKFTARSYSVLVGDIGTISHSLGGFNNKPVVVTSSNDLSPEESADVRELTFREL